MPKESPPRLFIGESPESLDTFNDNTLTPALSSAAKLITRSMIIKDEPSESQPRRQDILKAHRDLTLNFLVLLVKANALEPYEP